MTSLAPHHRVKFEGRAPSLRDLRDWFPRTEDSEPAMEPVRQDTSWLELTGLELMTPEELNNIAEFCQAEATALRATYRRLHRRHSCSIAAVKAAATEWLKKRGLLTGRAFSSGRRTTTTA